MAPPLTPVLIAGFVARPLPPALLQPLLGLAMHVVQRRHPGLFERLAGVGEPTFLIDPVDLPFVFVLRPDPLLPSLRAYEDAEGITATATIRGPLLALVDLLEGRVDGDALFFSRDLVIEGDTGAVVALRNAVDGAEIDLVEDVLGLFGPLARPARVVADGVRAILGRAARDLEVLRTAAIAPVLKRTEAQAADIRELEEKVTGLARRARRSGEA